MFQTAMALNLTLKKLDQHSAASLSALGSNLKEQFGIDLPSTSDLMQKGECTIEVLTEDLSEFTFLLAQAGIPIVVSRLTNSGTK